MRNIKLIIEFDGAGYCGWQRQPGSIKTVQGTIERAISIITDEKVLIDGSSRTDSGVHAKGMVASFKTNSKIPSGQFKDAINTKLPPDIAIIKSEQVSDDFHARYCSIGKTYCYNILNREEKVVLGRNYNWAIREKLDVQKMKGCCKYFIGKKDFRAFMSAGSDAKNTIRDVKDLHIKVVDNKISIYITADGFLYNMVRNIVGILVKVGKNKLEGSEIPKIIEEGERNNLGMCAPARGLFLEEVYYLEKY